MSERSGSRSSTGTGRTAGAGAGASASKGAAVALWVIVGGGLVYGVVQTVIRASQLFG